jgi:hypothetical protein
MATADGWMALNLARPDDVAAVEALVEGPVGDDPWATVEAVAAGGSAANLVERAQLLGIPAAVLGSAAGGLATSVTSAHWPPASAAAGLEGRRVADLSALWAGPLAARILAAAGADVVKVESPSRPDGARQTPAFYDWLHPLDQELVAVDLATDAGRRRLHQVLHEADVVISSSRSRALRQLGIDPASCGARDGRVWLSITGYGLDRDWVAFGDDAAVAGGLVAWDGNGGPVFCGDAIADPLSGLWGALEVMRAVGAGGGVVVDVAMAGVAAAMGTAGVGAAVGVDAVGVDAVVAQPRWPAPFASRVSGVT